MWLAELGRKNPAAKPFAVEVAFVELKQIWVLTVEH